MPGQRRKLGRAMTIPTKRFRALEATDIERVLEICRLAFGPIFEGFRQNVGAELFDRFYSDSEDRQIDDLRAFCEAGEDRTVIVAEWDGLVVGFVTLSANPAEQIGEIALNAVHPDYGCRGIGRDMVEFALARMKEEGILAVKVATGGDRSHAAARRTYEKAGFTNAIPSITMFKLL